VRNRQRETAWKKYEIRWEWSPNKAIIFKFLKKPKNLFNFGKKSKHCETGYLIGFAEWVCVWEQSKRVKKNIVYENKGENEWGMVSLAFFENKA